MSDAKKKAASELAAKNLAQLQKIDIAASKILDKVCEYSISINIVEFVHIDSFCCHIQNRSVDQGMGKVRMRGHALHLSES